MSHAAESTASPSSTTSARTRARQFYQEGYAEEVVYDKPTIQKLSHRRNRLGQVSRRISPGLVVLDVGAGPGGLLSLVAERSKSYLALDLSMPNLRSVVAQEVTGTNILAAQIDLNEGALPLRSASFDIVVCVVVMEFIFAPEALMAEMVRVVKPGGSLIVTVGNIVSLRNRIRALRGVSPRTTQFRNVTNGGALHTFSVSDLVGLARDCDLSIREISCSGRWSQFRSKWVNLLGDDIIIVAEKSIYSDLFTNVSADLRPLDISPQG